MSSPFANYPVPERTFMPSGTPSTPAAARGGAPIRGTGAKRGRKPKNTNASANANAGAEAPRTPSASQPSAQSSLQWIDPQLTGSSSSQPAPGTTNAAGGSSTPATTPDAQAALLAQGLSLPGASPAATPGSGGESGTPGPSGPAAATTAAGAPAGEEDGDGEDEILPAMADDDYSAQLSWQSQSKDNLKCVCCPPMQAYKLNAGARCRVLMDNFSPQQYDRFESYRRHALPKQAVRKVCSILTCLPLCPTNHRHLFRSSSKRQASRFRSPSRRSLPGFPRFSSAKSLRRVRSCSICHLQKLNLSIYCTARQVQARRGDTGPLSPDHLREAYRMYQEETGRVGAARPLRSKRLFVR